MIDILFFCLKEIMLKPSQKFIFKNNRNVKTFIEYKLDYFSKHSVINFFKFMFSREKKNLMCIHRALTKKNLS